MNSLVSGSLFEIFFAQKRRKNTKKEEKSCEKFGELKKVPTFAPAEREKHGSAKQFFRKKRIERLNKFGGSENIAYLCSPEQFESFYGKFESRGIGNGFKRRNKFFEVIKQLKVYSIKVCKNEDVIFKIPLSIAKI